jgi:hypothetical protein
MAWDLTPLLGVKRRLHAPLLDVEGPDPSGGGAPVLPRVLSLSASWVEPRFDLVAMAQGIARQSFWWKK